MRTPSRLFGTLAVALSVALAGCDAVDTADLADDDLADAALAISDAIATDAGGVLDDAVALASLPDAAKSGHHFGRFGCRAERESTYEDGTWTTVAECERGDADGPFYAQFSRTTTRRFLDAAGAPQQERDGAAAAEFAIVEGSGIVRTPRAERALDAIQSDVSVTGLDTDLVTLNGQFSREGVNTITRARGDRAGASRSVDYAVEMTATDVQGPVVRGDGRARWRNAVSGTLSGVYTATVTLTDADGETRTREIERTFEVTFPNEGGRRRARIAVGGQRFYGDLQTGEVTG